MIYAQEPIITTANSWEKKSELERKQVTGYKSGKGKLAYDAVQTTHATL